MQVYALDADIVMRMKPSSTMGAYCTTFSTDTGEGTLCAATGHLNMTAPDSRRWGVWAAAYTPNLRVSLAATAVIEAACSVPTGIFGAGTPSCIEGISINSGQNCTPQCQRGYFPSHKVLTCRDGQLSPAIFICNQNQASDIQTVDMVPIIAGSTGAVILLVCLLLICLCRHPGFTRQPTYTNTEESMDSLSAWWECSHEVEHGMCMFCGNQPNSQEGVENLQGPDTFFKCCSSCGAVLASLGYEVTPMHNFSALSRNSSQWIASQTTGHAGDRGASQNDLHNFSRETAFNTTSHAPNEDGSQNILVSFGQLPEDT